MKDMPYCATCSKPDFHTRVTSQALVACSLQERKADTGLPPTKHICISSEAAMINAGEQRLHPASAPSTDCDGTGRQAVHRQRQKVSWRSTKAEINHGVVQMTTGCGRKREGTAVEQTQEATRLGLRCTSRGGGGSGRWDKRRT